MRVAENLIECMMSEADVRVAENLIECMMSENVRRQVIGPGGLCIMHHMGRALRIRGAIRKYSKISIRKGV